MTDIESTKKSVMETSNEIITSDNTKNTYSDNDSVSSGNIDENNQLSYLLEPLSFTKNSNLYVVSVDDIPYFYVKDEKTAVEKMWEVTRKLSGKQFFSGYKTNTLKINERELHLLGSYRFFLIAYDTILHRINYSMVQECV